MDREEAFSLFSSKNDVVMLKMQSDDAMRMLQDKLDKERK